MSSASQLRQILNRTGRRIGNAFETSERFLMTPQRCHDLALKKLRGGEVSVRGSDAGPEQLERSLRIGRFHLTSLRQQLFGGRLSQKHSETNHRRHNDDD